MKELALVKKEETEQGIMQHVKQEKRVRLKAHELAKMDQDELNMIQVIEDTRRNVGEDMQEEVERKRKMAEERKNRKSSKHSEIDDKQLDK